MGLMKELNDLNNIYQKMYEQKKAKKDYDGDNKVESGSKEHAGVVHNAIQKKKGGKADGQDTRSEAMIVTNADKKGNTPAYQNMKKGMKGKDGKPMYKAADHMKKESYETKKKGEVLGAMKKQGRKLSDKEKNKIADKVVKDKGNTSKSDDRYAYEEVSPELTKLIESGKFSEEEINAILEAERSLGDRLHRKRKLYDKTTKKAMQFARDEGEASGHARYRMSSISREMDGIKAKMKKEK